MATDAPLVSLGHDTALTQLIVKQKREIDEQCQRFINIGDQESLHDLRVAMRRLHSLFSGYAHCFNKGNPQAETLRKLFKETNHARDLEVMLILLSRHQLSLPWLHQQWQSELDEEYRRLHEYLPSGWWTLSHQFDAPGTMLSSPLPDGTFGEYAAKQIKKKIKKLLKQTLRVCKHWDDKRAHQLRIRGKHIRYILEPFADEQQTVSEAVKQLKRFQDTLGDYHDLVVLKKRLQRKAHHLKSGQCNIPKRVIQQLKKAQKQQSKAIRHDYSGKSYRKLYEAVTGIYSELAQG